MRKIKPFKFHGEEFAEIVHIGWQGGKLMIDVRTDNFTPTQARSFAKWLLAAADEVEKCNKAGRLAKLSKVMEAE